MVMMIPRTFLAAFALVVSSAKVGMVMAGGCETIAEIAQGNSDLDTLVDALVRADLVDALDNDGPFTVFAPNDLAFKRLGVDLDDLSKADLTDILLYHVVTTGEVFSDDLEDGQRIRTLNGEKVEISINSNHVIRVNDARVVAADIEACNGVIHIISRVLIPPAPATDGDDDDDPKLDDIGDCSSSHKCGLCEGDCDKDSHCKDGLYCFQRDEHEFASVPHCRGGSSDGSGTDYCTKMDSGHDGSGSGKPDLDDIGDCTSSHKCGMCEGDCDSDSDCKSGLYCFQRSSGKNQDVPGCSGGDKDHSSTDYCTDEKQHY